MLLDLDGLWESTTGFGGVRESATGFGEVVGERYLI